MQFGFWQVYVATFVLTPSSTRVDVAPARRRRNVALAERVRLDFRGLDGDPVLEATEADVEDRRRRWEQGVTGRRRGAC